MTKTYKILHRKTGDLIMTYTVYDKKVDKMFWLQFKKIKDVNIVVVENA